MARKKEHTTKWALLLSRLRSTPGMRLYCTVTVTEKWSNELQRFEPAERHAWRAWDWTAGALPPPFLRPFVVQAKSAEALVKKGLVQLVRTWPAVPGAIRCEEYRPTEVAE